MPAAKLMMDFHIDEAQFLAFKQQGFTHIPLVKQVLADIHTPVSTYLRLANTNNSYLFESVHGGDTWGRYSIIGLQCQESYRVSGPAIERYEAGRWAESIEAENPLDWIEEYRQQRRVPELPGLPIHCGGLVGYFGHEIVQYIEPRLANIGNPDEIGVPDITLLVSDELVVFDNLKGQLYLIVHAPANEDQSYAKAQERLNNLEDKLRTATPAKYQRAELNQRAPALPFESGFGEAEFKAAVDKVKRYIRDGDAMQVVISQRMTAEFKGDPVNLYRALRTLNPSPYMYLLNLGEFHVVGASPEILVRLEEGKLSLRPIAGTRPRGKTEAEDLALEKELLVDPKELAEHLMLIDLGRNDVGRVAETGSVEVTDKMVIERYSHVMHIVSNVTGKVKAGYGPIDALKACFPAGTLSGAPKVRALEIIEELEPVKRGVYGGAVGYISWQGNMDTAIAIRTAVLKDGKIHVQAGAGLVADSVPENEWQETMNKAGAVLKAAAMVENAATGESV